MKTTILVPQEIEITHIRVTLPVLHGEEDIPNDFPMRTGKRWEAFIEVYTGKIVNWPKGKSGYLFLKVCDSGRYALYAGDKVIVTREDYVPHGIIPGEYGDYVELNIDQDGRITNWESKPSVSEFFQNS